MLLSLCHVKASGGRELGLLPCCPPSAYQDCLARGMPLAMSDWGPGTRPVLDGAQVPSYLAANGGKCPS